MDFHVVQRIEATGWVDRLLVVVKIDNVTADAIIVPLRTSIPTNPATRFEVATLCLADNDFLVGERKGLLP